MIVYTNVKLEPGKSIRMFGTRTLVIVNNTDQRGYRFENAQIDTLKKGYTSLIFINPDRQKREHITLGIFIGVNTKPISGSSFEGHTKKDEAWHTICTFCEGGEVKRGNSIWRLNKEFGWLEDEETEDEETLQDQTNFGGI